MSTLDKLNTFEESTLAYKLPYDLIFKIRDNIIGDYDANAYMISFLYNTLSERPDLEGEGGGGLTADFDMDDEINERLNNAPNQATKNMILI